MKKDKIFFGEVGLTTTSANYIANLAKESYKVLEQELQSIIFYNTTVKLLNSSEINLIREGMKSLSDIKQKLLDVAQLKSLIAWLREAIKAKDNLIAEARNMSYADFNLVPEVVPEKEPYLTENDVIATWGIKQRNRYYYLDTLCATIGSYIHPDGTFSRQRDEYQKILHEPHKVYGQGMDTLLYSYTPTLDSEEVEDTFMNLQQEYRGYQAELNSMKHQIEDCIQKDMTEKNLKYQKEIQDYSTKQAVIDAQLKECVHKVVLDTQNLKIIIPDSLKPIYNKLQKIGK